MHLPTMHSPKTQSTTLTVLFTIVLLLTIPLSAWRNIGAHINKVTSKAGLTWSIPDLDHVALRIIPASVHFELGEEAWDNLLPSGGHLVHTTEPDGTIKTHTVAMFHVLRCVGIMQKTYANEGSHVGDPLVEHCINYFRETFLCQSDMRNEPQGMTYTHNGFESLCYDWEPLFEAAEHNYEMHNKMMSQ